MSKREPRTAVGYARLAGALEGLEGCVRWLIEQHPDDERLNGLRNYITVIDRLDKAERVNV